MRNKSICNLIKAAGNNTWDREDKLNLNMQTFVWRRVRLHFELIMYPNLEKLDRKSVV